MGRTRFSGPVYGAKQTLATFSFNALSSGGGSGVSTIAWAAIVPVGEDWYVTEFGAHRGSTGSSQTAFWIQKGSTVLSSITMTSTTANINLQNRLTPAAGEKEGVRVPSGSTLTGWYSNAATQAPLGYCNWTVSGYRRFVASSLAE